MRLVALLLLLLGSPAFADSPLAAMEWLVGGQWESKTEVAPGYALETRTTVAFGPGKWSMRMRQYVKAKQGEYQQYETFFWVDPKQPRIQYITFHTQGAAVRGTGEIKDGVMTLHQAAVNPYPEMRLVFRPNAENRDQYRGEIFYKKGAAWDKVKSADSTRTKLSEPPKLKPPERRGKLELLAKFAGDFRYFEKSSNKLLGRHFHRFSLHGRLLVGWDYEQKGDKEVPGSMSVIWSDPISRKIESISVFATGAVTTAIVQAEGEGLTWDVTDTPREGTPVRSRVAVAWIESNTYEMQMLTQEDGKWKLTDFVAVGRRQKPTKRPR